jgi:hypothetical protein
MKTIISILLFLICLSKSAQQEKPLDTIYANDQKNVALFFPKPIRQGITGKDNFVFNYNQEKQQYFGLLQATPGKESNLLTITNDGKVYAYILKYGENLPKLNYFISEDERIGNEKPILEYKKLDTDSIQSESEDKGVYYNRFSEYLLRLKNESIVTKRKKGIVLKLLKLKYHKDQVYMVLETKNKSGIDFEIDYLNVYRINGNKKRRASYQALQQEVNYKYKLPNVIMNRHIKRFVYVLPKFVLGDNEKLMIELKELKGSRSVILKTKI